MSLEEVMEVFRKLGIEPRREMWTFSHWREQREEEKEQIWIINDTVTKPFEEDKEEEYI